MGKVRTIFAIFATNFFFLKNKINNIPSKNILPLKTDKHM